MPLFAMSPLLGPDLLAASDPSMCTCAYACSGWCPSQTRDIWPCLGVPAQRHIYSNLGLLVLVLGLARYETSKNGTERGDGAKDTETVAETLH